MIKAFTEVPLAKGQNIYLEVLGGKDSIRMQFVGEMKGAVSTAAENTGKDP